jgi:hypothetical protein
MKRLTIILAFLLTALVTNGQNTSQVIKDAFEAQYPGATETIWNMRNPQQPQATFEWNGKRYNSIFTAEGEWVRTFYSVEVTEVPLAVQDGFTASEFRLWSINNVTRVEYPENRVVYQYEISLEDANRIIRLDESGRLIE